jgi:hypothetical protein
MEEQKENKPLLQRIKELEGTKEPDKIKKKFWRLPFKAKVGRAKARKNWIGVIKLNENGSVDPFKCKIDEGVIVDKDGNPHVATADYVWFWKRKPVIIVPSWSTEPISRKYLQEAAERDKTLVLGHRLIINAMEKGQIDAKKKGGFGAIIVIGVLAVIGYLVYKSGAFGGG